VAFSELMSGRHQANIYVVKSDRHPLELLLSILYFAHSGILILYLAFRSYYLPEIGKTAIRKCGVSALWPRTLQNTNRIGYN
jgi:hypothetical protein